jgi:hypothetical protein
MASVPLREVPAPGPTKTPAWALESAPRREVAKTPARFKPETRLLVLAQRPMNRSTMRRWTVPFLWHPAHEAKRLLRQRVRKATRLQSRGFPYPVAIAIAIGLQAMVVKVLVR